MNKPTLDSIASAKAKLAEELRVLEEQEVQLREQEAADAFTQVLDLLGRYAQHFSASQKAEVAGLVASPAAKPKKAAPDKKPVAPKYWLPHNGETWSGRGRPPKAFKAWEGTVAHREWKANHPNEKYPKFPG